MLDGSAFQQNTPLEDIFRRFHAAPETPDTPARMTTYVTVGGVALATTAVILSAPLHVPLLGIILVLAGIGTLCYAIIRAF